MFTSQVCFSSYNLEILLDTRAQIFRVFILTSAIFPLEGFKRESSLLASDMNGTCLCLPGMKMDICRRSTMLCNITSRECYFWMRGWTVVGHWLSCNWCDTTCHWNVMCVMDRYTSNYVKPDYPVSFLRLDSGTTSTSCRFLRTLARLAAYCERSTNT